MDIATINSKLYDGDIDVPGLFPHLDNLKKENLIFDIDFGLTELPTEPGIILIRGARQYGKSTWLESQLHSTIKKNGPGCAYYLNGEYIVDANQLELEINNLINIYKKATPLRYLFIDEITAIPNWETALKRTADQGILANVLIVTTGSKATDLRRGAEKLPGRKGKLNRTSYLFTPVSYSAFYRRCKNIFKSNTVIAYLLSGGSPIACSELAKNGTIPEYVIELTRDWIEGEIAASGRNRSSLMNVMNVIFRFGGSAVGQAKLAREAGLANNTVAAGYIEILNDLGCVIPTFPWDESRKILILRKECKYHFTNLLAALSYYPGHIRNINDFNSLIKTEQAKWFEWLIAQEITRRLAIKGVSILEPLAFWQNKNHEIDFVDREQHYIEVKAGKCSPLEFSWFTNQFKNKTLSIISTKSFETNQLKGLTLEDFLLNEEN